jgi:NAD/NADP transhydrogenase alpha subunit
MIVGILKEIKTEENRVCMTPAGVEVMIHNGHTVLVEKNAGAGSGFADEAYIKAGAKIDRHPQGDFRCGRHGHACQRAPASRVRPDPRRPDRVHLPAPGGRRDPDECA